MIEIIVLIIFFVIIFQQFFKIKFTYDVLKNNGSLKVYLFGFLPIYCQKIQIKSGFIELINNPKKVKKIKIKVSRNELQKFKNQVHIILKNQFIKTIKINSKFSIKNKPFFGAMFNGIYLSLLNVFKSIKTANNDILKIDINCNSDFNNTEFKIESFIKVKFSILDFIKVALEISSMKRRLNYE